MAVCAAAQADARNEKSGLPFASEGLSTEVKPAHEKISDDKMTQISDLDKRYGLLSIGGISTFTVANIKSANTEH